MPSQILHTLFLEDSINGIRNIPNTPPPEALYASHKLLMNLAAQGPDIFYHNQRTLPSALRYGRLLHRSQYGKLITEMARIALLQDKSGSGGFEETAAFIIGFATHAMLDRETHPFIIAFAGDCYQCHPFFERILDVLMLRKLRSLAIEDIDLSAWFPRGNLPPHVEELIVSAVNAVYGSRLHPLRIGELENAVKDSLSFYSWTNPRTAKATRVLAYLRDREENGGRRRLALFHPQSGLPDQDYLNMNEKEWVNPFDPENVNRESFLRLYDRASYKARNVIGTLYRCLWREEELKMMEDVVGNDNLNGSDGVGAVVGSCLLQKSCGDRLSLSTILDGMYQTLGRKYPEL